MELEAVTKEMEDDEDRERGEDEPEGDIGGVEVPEPVDFLERRLKKERGAVALGVITKETKEESDCVRLPLFKLLRRSGVD